SAALANCDTARFTTASRRRFGPTAPVSPPPCPGSSTTVGVAIGVPADSVAWLPHGVSTVQPVGVLRSTGRAKPRGDMTALAGGSVAGGVVGTGGAVVVVLDVVVGTVPAARSSGMRVDAEPHAVAKSSAATASLNMRLRATGTRLHKRQGR